MGVSLCSSKRIEDSRMWLKYLERRTERLDKGTCQRLQQAPKTLALLGNAAARARDQGPTDGPPGTDAVAATFHENMDGSINEFYLWHGTTHEVANLIAETGFKLTETTHGKRFGPGAYFAEDPLKSLEYAPAEEGV